MTAIQLGRLERHDLRAIWTDEAREFTPWLAQRENLAILGEALGMQLELEAKEKPVGPFQADILCRDIENDHWVLIENQLERTNHRHLGQLLTYASGLEAVTIIWIAATFTEEHRATLDWLNRITDDSFRFFGVELELWRIGDSPAAAKFNIVSKPNPWSHSVAQAARAIEDADLSETHIFQREYWAALNKVLEAAGGPVRNDKTPPPRQWMNFPIGRSKFRLTATMLRGESRIRAKLHLAGPHAKAHFGLLKAQREEIERELGYPLEWEEFPQQRDSRISAYLNGVDSEDRSEWPHQHDWLAKRLNDLHRAFAPRVSALDADAWRPETA
jgi:hypothetical protein